MPFVSKSQVRACHAAGDPKWDCRLWADHTPDVKNLPERKKEKKGLDSMSVAERLGREAAAVPMVEKLASDADLSVDDVYRFADSVGLAPAAFVKRAYADVDGFLEFLKASRGVKTVKEAGFLNNLLATMKKGVGSAGAKIAPMAEQAKAGLQSAVSPGFAAAGSATSLPGVDPKGLAGRLFNRSAPSQAPGVTGAVDRFLGKTPMGGSIAGRAATGGAGGALAGTAAASAGKAAFGGKPEAPTPSPAPEAKNPVGDTGGGDWGEQPKPAPQESVGRGQENSPAQGMSGSAKALLGLGGAAALGGGAYALARGRKKKPRDKEASDAEFAKDVMRAAIVKKANEWYRGEAASILCAHLDKVASHMSLEKQASLRTVQREVASGRDLSVAIKLAYPHLSGEQRGILAHTMCEAASKSAEKHAAERKKKPTQTERTFHGKPSEAAAFMRS